jgi:hypothetical protein
LNGILLKRVLIFLHRWLGVALCVLFLIWFPSGIGMMYWGFPEVTAADRLSRSPVLNAARVKLSPADAFKTLGVEGPSGTVRLDTFDGRPVYRFSRRGGQHIVYADTGEEQRLVSKEMVDRAAAAWTGQPVSAASITPVTEVDQWTLQARVRDIQPLWKYAWPNGEEVYVSGESGEVVQYTTRGSRLGAYVGAIPHWFYFTPLRKNGPQWSRVVIWTSGIGTFSAIIGIVVGIWMYSPSRRYQRAGVPTSIPYRGQKRWHMVLGLIFGLGAVTWAFSGMLSMDPFPARTNRPAANAPVPAAGAGDVRVARSLPGSLRGRTSLEAYDRKLPQQVLFDLASLRVKELELTAVGNRALYIASLEGGATRIVPVDGPVMLQFETDTIAGIVKAAAGKTLEEMRLLDQYDRYYLDRRRTRPLPVVLVRLNDPEQTRYYVDPKTARVVGSYSSGNWTTRWVYHGLHSLDFPWLYNYRPLWDIVVITFMLGGTALCVTSLILAWRVLGRTLRSLVPGGRARSPVSEDLA